MSCTEKQQSAIAEVRDQISLDYSDGEYLNHVAANLGLNRPFFGFGDDTWRAIVKALALTSKQIRQRFYDILTIIFGPKVTQGGTLSSSAVIGDKILRLNETINFPQIGTVILDEGQVSEEELEYCFIDRTQKIMYLETPTTFNHVLNDTDDERPLTISAEAGDTNIFVSYSNFFPTTGTVVLGRGTENEEVVVITANNKDINRLTVSPALSFDHVGLTPSIIQSSLSLPYATTSEFLLLNSTNKFPDSGHILLAASSNTFTTVSGTTTSVTCAASTFTSDRQVSNIVVFTGNVTAALAGVEAQIITNTSTVLNFKDTLPATPVAGDTFKIRVRAEYTRNSYEDNALQLRRNITDVVLNSGLEVELLTPGATVLLAPVKTTGKGWDVIQSSPKNIEILIPDSIQDINTVRSASYLHPDLQTVASTALTASYTIGDTELDVTASSLATWPFAGQLVIDLGGGNEEYIGYYKLDDSTFVVSRLDGIQSNHLITETVTYVEVAHAGTDLQSGDLWSEENVFPGPYLYDIKEDSPNTAGMASIQLTAPLAGPSFLVVGQLVGNTALEVDNAINFGLTSGFPYQAVVGKDSGNKETINIVDVNLAQRTRTTVAVASIVGATSIQVASLTPFGDPAGNFPNVNGYRARVGRGSANDEVVWVTGTATGPSRLVIEAAVNPHGIGESVELIADVLSVDPLDDVHAGLIPYASRKSLSPPGVSTTLSVSANEGGTFITVVSNSGFNAVGKLLLDGDEYLYSRSGSTILNILNSGGLRRDYSSSLIVYHIFERFLGESVDRLYESIEVNTTTGFSASGGSFILNFGQNLTDVTSETIAVVNVNDTVLSLSDTSLLPTTYPYMVVIGPGTYNEERVLVTLNNTGADQLTINNAIVGAKFSHAVGEKVLFVGGVQEKLTYNTLTSTSFGFSTPIMLQSIHPTATKVTRTLRRSLPIKTGYDFPFRMPTDIAFRLKFLIDLIRAAGVQVSMINAR